MGCNTDGAEHESSTWRGGRPCGGMPWRRGGSCRRRCGGCREDWLCRWANDGLDRTDDGCLGGTSDVRRLHNTAHKRRNRTSSYLKHPGNAIFSYLHVVWCISCKMSPCEFYQWNKTDKPVHRFIMWIQDFHSNQIFYKEPYNSVLFLHKLLPLLHILTRRLILAMKFDVFNNEEGNDALNEH